MSHAINSKAPPSSGMNHQVLQRVMSSPRLPSLPTIALDIIELVQKPDVTIKEIADTIQLDPALSSKVLRTVNSSFYGQSKTISSISQALVVLGLRAVKTLALGFSLVGNLKDVASEEFAEYGFWKRSLFTATAAKAVAQRVGLQHQEECFLAALMQDLGMLALQQALGDEYTVIVEAAGPLHRRLIRHELEGLGLSHPQVGGALAEKWKLPRLLSQPIQLHEQPEDAPADMKLMVRAIGVGNSVADIYQDPDDSEAVQEYYRKMQSWFNIEREESQELLTGLFQPATEMQRLFELPTGELGDPDVILAKANEALELISLQSDREAGELRDSNERLNDEVNTDPLTGVANRRRFNNYASEVFAASGPDHPMAVVFLDADHFKQFNDTHGHATGDRVLIELGRILRANVPLPGLPCRYGGEEFAIILPQHDRRQAAVLAENIRQVVESTPVQSEKGDTLQVTISMGVAVHDGTVFRHVDQLVRAADQGVYAAKHGGRNCVRVLCRSPERQPRKVGQLPLTGRRIIRMVIIVGRLDLRFDLLNLPRGEIQLTHRFNLGRPTNNREPVTI